VSGDWLGCRTPDQDDPRRKPDPAQVLPALIRSGGAMSGPRMIAIVLGTSLPLLLASAGWSDGPSKDGRTKKYAELVAQLVSPNKEPVTANEDEGSVKFPKEYDRAAQRRIDRARMALQDEIEDALPYLIDALEDERYCMTINWGEGSKYYNYSVGEICKDLIASRLEIYREKMQFSLPRWHEYDYPVSKAWWKKRKNRSLVELQVEAIDWAIKRRKAEAEKERREEELAALRKLRERIAKSGKPAKGNRMLPMVVIDH
jgi:hypothetical protein